MREKMEKRVEFNRLLDFYGALLTEHRRDIMHAYLEEDLSLQEIADSMSITRQGVHDAINKAEKQLMAYEEKLGLLKRYQRLMHAVALCRNEIAGTDHERSLENIKRILDEIEDIER